MGHKEGDRVMRDLRKNRLDRKWLIRLGVAGSVMFLGVPAIAFFGGGFIHGGYLGELPASWFEEEVCTTEGITLTTQSIFHIRQWEIKPSILRDDGDPNTYVKCSITASLDEMVCNVGFPDGTVLGCGDDGGPHQLPREGDTIYITMDEAPSTHCEIIVGTGDSFGIADPKCRQPEGTGGGGSVSTCSAATAAAVLNTGQSTTIASNSCIQLVNQPTWSSVNPSIHPYPGTASYPVPFSYTSCAGGGEGSLTGNFNAAYLMDGPNPGPNYGCDIFLKLEGNGSPVQFTYWQ